MSLSRIEVVVRTGDLALARYLLAPGEYLLGSDPCCDLQVDSPDVSRRHARLVVEAEELRIEDLGSTNGTSIDGETVAALAAFKPPREVRLGSTKRGQNQKGVKP